MTAKWTCRRCRMGFRAGPPGNPGGDVEFLRCPDCGRRFWADPCGAGGRCAVGLLPPAVAAAASSISGARR